MLRRTFVAGFALAIIVALGAPPAASQISDNYSFEGWKVTIQAERSVRSYRSSPVPGGVAIKFNDGVVVQIVDRRITVNGQPRETEPFDELELLLKGNGEVVARVVKGKK